MDGAQIVDSTKLNDWIQAVGLFNGTLGPALYDAVVQEISMHSGSVRGTESVNDAERRARHMLWAWESERFIFNLDFQLFVDGILSMKR